MTSYEDLCDMAEQNRLQTNALSAIESARALTRELDNKAKIEMRNVAVAVSAHIFAAIIMHTAKQIIIKKVPL